MVALSSLKKVSIFSGLGRAELALLESRSSRRRFPEGSIVIRDGEDSDSMFIILSGEVDVLVTNKEGERIKVDTLGKDDYFGEYAVLDGSKRSAWVITTEETNMLVITRDSIIDLIVDNPQSALSMMSDLVSRIRELTASLKHA